MKTTHRRRGFTLLELLIVIVIIAILAALAFPNIREARVKALGSRSGAALKNLNNGLSQWELEHSGPPSDINSNQVATAPVSPQVVDETDPNIMLVRELSRYVENTSGLWTSPAARNLTGAARNCYFYEVYEELESGSNVATGALKGVIQSGANAHPRFEPRAADVPNSPTLTQYPAFTEAMVNGYEDFQLIPIGATPPTQLGWQP